MSVESFAIWFGIVTGVVGLVAAIIQFGGEKILKVAATLGVVVLCGTCAWFVVKYTSSMNSPESSPPIEITAQTFIGDVAANPDLAKRVYRNKRVQVSGEVKTGGLNEQYAAIDFGDRSSGTAVVSCQSREPRWVETCKQLFREVGKHHKPIRVSVVGMVDDFSEGEDKLWTLPVGNTPSTWTGSGKRYHFVTVVGCAFVEQPMFEPATTGAVPEFSDDLYKQVVRVDARTIRVVEIPNARWVLLLPPQTPIPITAATGVNGLQYTHPTDLPEGTKIYFDPTDGRQPSRSRPLPPVAPAAR